MKYCFWLTAGAGVTLGFSFTPIEGAFQARPGGYLFSPYTWNLEGRLRNLKRPPFRGIESHHFSFCATVKIRVFASGPLNFKAAVSAESKVICALSLYSKSLPNRPTGQSGR
jgi:hypothetical protein